MNIFACLSAAPWSAEPARAQQLLARFRGAQILFFEADAGVKPRGGRPEGRQVRPNVTVYTLPSAAGLGDYSPLLYRQNLRKRKAFLLDRLARHGACDAVFWVTSPAYAQLADELPHRGLVYDCDRFWPERDALREGRLAAAADVVFAASPGLKERLSPCNSNIVVLPNGVNFSMFSRAQAGSAPGFPDGPGPVFGLSQRVDAHTDLSPLLYAAAARPDWRFLLLGGGEKALLSSLCKRLRNVFVPDALLPLERPDYLARCDVHLALLREDPSEGDIVPARLYEALSTGKPVVSMLWPDEVERFPDVVYGAHAREEFLRLCEKSLEESPGWVSERRKDYGRAAAWSGRSDEAAQILQTIGLY